MPVGSARFSTKRRRCLLFLCSRFCLPRCDIVLSGPSRACSASPLLRHDASNGRVAFCNIDCPTENGYDEANPRQPSACPHPSHSSNRMGFGGPSRNQNGDSRLGACISSSSLILGTMRLVSWPPAVLFQDLTQLELAYALQRHASPGQFTGLFIVYVVTWSPRSMTNSASQLLPFTTMSRGSGQAKAARLPFASRGHRCCHHRIREAR